MRISGPLTVALLGVACASSKHHPTSGTSEDCFYDCKPGSSESTASTDPKRTNVASGTTVDPAKPAGKLTPAQEKAAALREAADLIEKAQKAHDSGNKNLADQLFSTAELLTGSEAVAALASEFREGAPPA